MMTVACAGLLSMLLAPALAPLPSTQVVLMPPESTGAAPIVPQLTIGTPARPKPKFSRLFELPSPPPVVAPGPVAVDSVRGRPEVVCGLRIFRVDPSIDPGIVLRRPDSGTHYTMRVFEGPVPCR
jgi:hypothetical protein